MVRRPLQQPCDPRHTVHSPHRDLECFPQLVHAHETSGSVMAIQRGTGRRRQRSESLQQAQHQQNPIEQPSCPLWSWNRLPKLTFETIDHYPDALATGYDKLGPIYIGPIKIDFLALRHVIC